MSKKSPTISGTLLIILATCGTAVAQDAGDDFVLKSLTMLLAVNTVDASVRIETFVNGKAYTAIGRYEEQALTRAAPGLPPPFLRSMYRLDITFFPLSAEPNRMTLVCYPGTNGERSRMERYTHIEGVKSFGTIDLTRLEERLREADREMFFTQVSEVRNLGGLAGKIRQISRFYEFSLPVQENLQGEETIPTLKLTGRLRSVHHRELLSLFGGLNKRGDYPADFPSDIELWLGRHNDFPYKIRYLRRISEESEQKELLFQETFSNVIVNGTPIPAARFAPLPPPEDVFSILDDTDNFIQTLGL